MAKNLIDKLRDELLIAKTENPILDEEAKIKESSKLLDKSVGNNKNIVFHGSHNSHGDWGKHWAHGGYEDDEPTDQIEQTTPTL